MTSQLFGWVNQYLPVLTAKSAWQSPLLVTVPRIIPATGEAAAGPAGEAMRLATKATKDCMTGAQAKDCELSAAVSSMFHTSRISRIMVIQ